MCSECNSRILSGKTASYKWGIANIEISACPKHFLEVKTILDKIQDISDQKTNDLIDEGRLK